MRNNEASVHAYTDGRAEGLPGTGERQKGASQGFLSELERKERGMKTDKGFAKLADPDFVLDTRPFFGPRLCDAPKDVDRDVFRFLGLGRFLDD